jgi:prevent-host-death family protein
MMPRGRVLLVDDQPSILASYGRALSSAGFEVTKAGGGDEAFRRLENALFDVVLTDLLVPKASGLAFLERLHTFSPELPVIVMFDKQSNEIAIEAAELGALQSLVKPIGPALLKRTVDRAVRARRARQDAAPAFLPRQGEALTPIRITATDAKNQMGHVLETVMQGRVVLITKRETPKAAVIPMAEYEKFSRATEAKLNALSSEFDALLARMQAPEARVGMQAAFDATPEQLARAAVTFARKRA